MHFSKSHGITSNLWSIEIPDEFELWFGQIAPFLDIYIEKYIDVLKTDINMLQSHPYGANFW